MRYGSIDKATCIYVRVFVIFLCSPDGFGDRSRGFLTDEHVASESLQSGVLRDEAEVAMIARVKRAERYIFQRVEIVVTGSLTFLQSRVGTIRDNNFTLFLRVDSRLIFDQSKK